MPELGANDSEARQLTAPSPRALTLRFGGWVEAVGLLWIYLAYSQLRAMAEGSEQLALGAAMPSMHVTWSTWVALALWPLVRRRRNLLRALLVAYPVSILLSVTITGNHWFLDAVGGWIVLALSYRLSIAIERVLITRRAAAPSYATPSTTQSG